MLEEVANSGSKRNLGGYDGYGVRDASVRVPYAEKGKKNRINWKDLQKPPLLVTRLCYNPSLPLADTKWSLFGLHFFSIYAVYSVFMRLLEF